MIATIRNLKRRVDQKSSNHQKLLLAYVARSYDLRQCYGLVSDPL